MLSVLGEDKLELKIGYMSTKNDIMLKNALNYISNNLDCKFVKYREEDIEKALDDLENNQVMAVLMIENEKVQGMNIAQYGIRFVYNDNNELVTELFGDLIYAGLSDYQTYSTATETFKSVYSDDEKEWELQNVIFL